MPRWQLLRSSSKHLVRTDGWLVENHYRKAEQVKCGMCFAASTHSLMFPIGGTFSMIAFLPIIALGFFLGMRHATDPDHVIAVVPLSLLIIVGAKLALTG